MSVTSKQDLIHEVSQAFAEKIPQAHAEVALSLLADAMGHYDVESVGGHGDESMDQKDCLEAYLTALRIEEKSPQTLALYEYIIRAFYKHCNRGPRHTTVFHIRDYLSNCKRKGNSDRTVSNYRSILATYFKWLAREGLIAMDPMGNISPIRYEKKVKDTYSGVDIYKLYENCSVKRGPRCNPERNYAILAMMEATGCRVSEICSANRDSIDFDTGECVVHGKGNKERTVYLDDVSLMLIRRYLDTRTDSLPALFIGKGSNRLTPNGVRDFLRKCGNRAGVNHVHPHKFRRTLATNLIEAGMPFQEVSLLLGHERLDTTMTYVNIKNHTIKNSYAKYY